MNRRTIFPLSAGALLFPLMWLGALSSSVGFASTYAERDDVYSNQIVLKVGFDLRNFSFRQAPELFQVHGHSSSGSTTIASVVLLNGTNLNSTSAEPVKISSNGDLAFRVWNAGKGKDRLAEVSRGWAGQEPYFAPPTELSLAGGQADNVEIMAGPKLAKLIAGAALASNGLMNPAEYYAIAPDMRAKAEELLRMILLGKPSETEFPVSFNVDAGARKGQADARLIVKLSESYSSQYVVVGAEKKLVAGIKEKNSNYCRAHNISDIDRRYCGVAIGIDSANEISSFFYGKWKDGSVLSPQAVTSIDKGGVTPLMKFSGTYCMPADDRGASGFRSGSGSDRQKKIKAFAQMLKSVTDAQTRDLNGRSALFYALYFGCEEEARLLLSRGASMGEADKFGNPAFSYAVAGRLGKLAAQALPHLQADQLISDNFEDSTYQRKNQEPGVLPELKYFKAIPTAQQFESPLFDKLLEKKPALTEEQIKNLLNSAIYKKSAVTLRVLTQRGYFPAAGSDPNTLANISMAYKNSSEADRKQYKDFFDLLSPMAAKAQKQKTAVCQWSEHGQDDCLLENQMCEDIKWPRTRDACWVGVGECNKIQDPREAWRCKGKYGGDFERTMCEKIAKDTRSYQICSAYAGNEAEKIQAISHLLASWEGIGLLESNYLDRDASLSPDGWKKVQSACDDNFDLIVRAGGYRVNRLCSHASIGENSAELEQVKVLVGKCAADGSWKECRWPLIGGAWAHFRDNAQRGLIRFCKLGEGAACKTVMDSQTAAFTPEEQTKILKRMCFDQKNYWACQRIPIPGGGHYSGFGVLEVTDPIEQGKIQLGRALQIGFWTDLDEYSELKTFLKKIPPTPDLVQPYLADLEGACGFNPKACFYLYEYYRAKNDERSAMALDAKIINRLNVDLYRYMDIKRYFSFDEARPAIGVAFKQMCDRGHIAACRESKARLAPTGGKPATLAEYRDLCPGMGKGAVTGQCMQLARDLLTHGTADLELQAEICGTQGPSFINECKGWKDATDELGFNPAALHRLEQSCLRDKNPAICQTVGNHFLRSQPAEAQKYFAASCAGGALSDQRSDCPQNLSLLTRLGKTAEAAKEVNRICGLSIQSQICQAKDVYLAPVNGRRELERTLIGKCRAGESANCSKLELLYQLNSRDWGKQEGRALVCQKYGRRCGP